MRMPHVRRSTAAPHPGLEQVEMDGISRSIRAPGHEERQAGR